MNVSERSRTFIFVHERSGFQHVNVRGSIYVWRINMKICNNRHLTCHKIKSDLNLSVFIQRPFTRFLNRKILIQSFAKLFLKKIELNDIFPVNYLIA